MPFYNQNFHSSNVDLESVYVDSQALFAFKKGASTQSQTDVLSFVLLSLLVARKKWSSFDDSKSWFNEFQTTMSKIGFMTTSSEWNSFNVPSETTLSKAVLDKTEGDLHDGAEQALKAAGKSENEVALRVLNSAATEGRKFALLTGYSTRDGNATLALYGFFGSSKSNDNFLEGGLKKGDEVTYGKIEAVLSDAIAENFRDPVMEKLGNYYEDNFKSVEF